MKKRERKEKEYVGYRGNTGNRGNYNEIIKNYQLEMKIVHKVPKSYYSEEGGVKKI